MPIFKNRFVFSEAYVPSKILHRDDEISLIYTAISPIKQGEKPLNIFIYGQTGTGKTLVTKYVLSKIGDYIYINCKFAGITKRIESFIREFSLQLGQDFYDLTDVIQYIRDKKLIIVFDEVDQLSKDLGDEILYTFTRAPGNIGIIGISNNIFFVDRLDPRVRSSLSELEILFKPYNALQLRDILLERAKEGLYENSYDLAAISYIAAVTAREYGDARRAINLLRLAGEIAERKGKNKIELEDAKEAIELEEKDKVKFVIESLPLQSKLVLKSIAELKDTTLGKAYELYYRKSLEKSVTPITFRRFVEIVNDLETLGLVSIDFALLNGKRVRKVKTFISPKIIDL
ncbi:NEQ057 [Nanoarchaeum equitans Kin4-M]|uniref:ORC1-type DNA replication protein n=1 Tax=Nanoarchaeum equitans (strain Kin4-M) TaxID=228908 RepID=Q74MI0_NANEQ|nr:NEQ057 [Nanoarchaeum equitans Kin4-M]